MNDVCPVIERYIAIWNEPDPVRRRALIARTWTEDATYVDPLALAEGHDAIDATVTAAQAQFPGFVFRLSGPVDAHHHVARFTWELAPGADADAIVVGFDVAVFAGDGRLRAVHGFLDKVPTP
jgi:SnoaL-like domain